MNKERSTQLKEIYELIAVAQTIQKQYAIMKSRKAQARVIANHALGFEETDGGY